MRNIRRFVDIGFPIAGTAIVFLAVLLLWHDIVLQLITVLIGLLLIEAGIWKLTQPLLPDERRYRALRDEVDDFIDLARRLNHAAVAARSDPAAEESFRSARLQMHESVERMALFAGEEIGRSEILARHEVTV